LIKGHGLVEKKSALWSEEGVGNANNVLNGEGGGGVKIAWGGHGYAINVIRKKRDG